MIDVMSTSGAGPARMAWVEAARPSSRLTAAAAAERERLERDARGLERRAEALAAQLQKLVEGREEIRRQLEILDQLAPPLEQVEVTTEGLEAAAEDQVSSSEPPNGYLSGSRIRSVAVHLLAASRAAAQPIHYHAWYELMKQAGFGIRARDPVGTFLTQISRSPVVEKADGPGLYRLDIAAPRELHTRLRDLQDELTQLHGGQQTLDAIASSRERRVELTAEIGRVERALEEALAALGMETDLEVNPRQSKRALLSGGRYVLESRRG